MEKISKSLGSLAYSVQGRGEPLVMLRGLGRSSRYWLGYEKLIARHFKVILCDMRGIGQSSEPMHWQTRVEDLAEDLELILSTLKIKSAHVFGLSLGGMVALAFAKRYPKACRTLVIANSSHQESFYPRIYPSALLEIAWGFARGEGHKTILKRTVSGPAALSRGEEILRLWAEIRAEEGGLPWLTMAKQIVAAACFHWEAGEGPQPPTLILYGDQDGLVPHLHSRLLAERIPGSRLQVIRGASHEIQMGHEKEILEILRQHCQRTLRAVANQP